MGPGALRRSLTLAVQRAATGRGPDGAVRLAPPTSPARGRLYYGPDVTCTAAGANPQAPRQQKSRHAREEAVQSLSRLNDAAERAMKGAVALGSYRASPTRRTVLSL